MITDTIKWGETYDISAPAADADGILLDPPIDSTWQAAMTITKGRRVGGAAFLSPALTIVAGAATCSIDTGDEPWEAGNYVYDIRFTDPDGNDYWSEPVLLTLENRNTPRS